MEKLYKAALHVHMLHRRSTSLLPVNLGPSDRKGAYKFVHAQLAMGTPHFTSYSQPS